MRIAVIGAGAMGVALTVALTRIGHRVAITSTRKPSALAPLASRLGPRVFVEDNADAIQWSELVVMAVPWIARTCVSSSAGVAGKIVLDVMNAYAAYPNIVDLGGIPSSCIVASEIPSAHVIKALNTLCARDIATSGRPRGSPHRRAVPVCGDDEHAKEVIATLVEDMGFDAVDVGFLRNGAWAEPGGPFFGGIWSRTELIEIHSQVCCLPDAWNQ